jgi:hypothetical protein
LVKTAMMWVGSLLITFTVQEVLESTLLVHTAYWNTCQLYEIKHGVGLLFLLLKA